MRDGFVIVDGHAHTYMRDLAPKIISSFTELHRMEPTGSLGKGTVEDLLERMGSGGIDKAVLANFGPVKAVDRINAWNLAGCGTDDRLVPLVSVYPGMRVKDLEELVDQGAKGVKMHNGIQEFDACDPGLDEVYDVCASRGLPVTLHCGETSRVHLNEYTDEAHVESAVRSHGNVTFVLTHLAAGNPRTLFRLAESYRNMVIDTSIAFSGEHCIRRIHDDFWEDDRNVVEAFRKIGCDRISFGSDYPYGSPASDVRRILSLDLTEEEKSRILGLNTLELYGIDVPLRRGQSQAEAHAERSFSEAPDGKRLPASTLAPGARDAMFFPESPMSLPPEVANGTTVFPAKSQDSMNVSMIDGSLYHHTGNPTKTTSYAETSAFEDMAGLEDLSLISMVLLLFLSLQSRSASV
ncbi:MAG: amidohydrolase family protein [Candidatus Methanomethylophilaceae archaeon]|nr:amidohydrolase family protein [Candidatus Methanomethylophilaceae archaeon]